MENEVKYESKFLRGLLQLPLVNSLTNQVSDVYNRTKESNAYIKITMEIAESILMCGVESAKPLMSQLEEDIDNMAYEHLKKLEANCPYIALPPAVILDCSKQALQEVKYCGVKASDAVKGYYENFHQIKEYGWDKIFTITNYRTLPLKEKAPTNFNNADIEMVPMTGRTTNNHISLDECENMEVAITQSSNNTVKKLKILSQAAHSTFRCTALDQLGKLKQKADQVLAELKAVLYLLQTNIHFYTRNNKDENAEDTSDKQAKMLEKAQDLTQSLMNIFNQATSVLNYLSTNANQSFMQGTEDAYNLWKSFNLASAAEEITEVVFQHIHENIQKLERVIASYWNLRFLTVPYFTTEKTSLPSSDGSPEKFENPISSQT